MKIEKVSDDTSSKASLCARDENQGQRHSNPTNQTQLNPTPTTTDQKVLSSRDQVFCLFKI